MKLTLNHTQRLNLHALLGAQRTDVGSIRAIWAVQDKIALDSEEERAIELRSEVVNGREHKIWNPSIALRPKEVDLSDLEITFIKGALEAWNAYAAGADRVWLEPLVKNLFLSDVAAEARS